MFAKIINCIIPEAEVAPIEQQSSQLKQGQDNSKQP